MGIFVTTMMVRSLSLLYFIGRLFPDMEREVAWDGCDDRRLPPRLATHPSHARAGARRDRADWGAGRGGGPFLS